MIGCGRVDEGILRNLKSDAGYGVSVATGPSSPWTKNSTADLPVYVDSPQVKSPLRNAYDA